MHAHASGHACARPPQLNRISRVYECALQVRVCVLLLFRESIHCVCLSVCTCTSVCPEVCIYNAEVLSMCNKHLMLGQKYSVNSHEKRSNTHTHLTDESTAKMSGVRTDNWLLFKSSVLYRGEKESQADSCQVYSEKQTNKYMNIYTHKHNVCMFVCMIV